MAINPIPIVGDLAVASNRLQEWLTGGFISRLPQACPVNQVVTRSTYTPPSAAPPTMGDLSGQLSDGTANPADAEVMSSQPPEIHALMRHWDPLRSSAEEAQATSAIAMLDTAVSLAQAKDLLGAREICATVVLEAQPLLATRKELLQAALHAMLLSHGFKLLARMAAAIAGRRVQMVLLPASTGQIAPPQIQEDPRHTIYFLDPRWLEQLAGDDIFLRRLCDSLIASNEAKLVEPPLATLHTEAA